jgi:hypothetical protein
MLQDMQIILLSCSKTAVIPYSKNILLKGLKESTLFGWAAVHKSQVPWPDAEQWVEMVALLDKIMNTSYSAFWACKGTFRNQEV